MTIYKTFSLSLVDWVIILTLALAAYLLSISQPFGVSPDYENYEIFFQGVRADFFGVAGEIRFEPGFVYLAGVLTNFFESDLIVYGILVFISIVLKLYFVRRVSYGCFAFAALIFYIFKIFPLHELTQLRAALSVSFVLGACFLIWGGRRWQGVLMLVPAFFFHYSSLMVVPFLFLPRLERGKAFAFAFCIFLFLFFISQHVVIVLANFLPVFQGYESFGYGGRELNPVSIVFFPEFFIILFGFIFWRDLGDVMRRVLVLQLIGFAIFYGTIQFDVIAVRGREFFSVLWVFFIGLAMMSTPRVKVAVLLFVLMSVVLGFYVYFMGDFFH